MRFSPPYLFGRKTPLLYCQSGRNWSTRVKGGLGERSRPVVPPATHFSLPGLGLGNYKAKPLSIPRGVYRENALQPPYQFGRKTPLLYCLSGRNRSLILEGGLGERLRPAVPPATLISIPGVGMGPSKARPYQFREGYIGKRRFSPPPQHFGRKTPLFYCQSGPNRFPRVEGGLR